MSPETTKMQARFWIVIGLVVAGLLWALSPVLFPFVTGLVLAYFLAPVVNALEKRKIPRWLGALLVMSGFMMLAGLIVTLILPIISDEMGHLINAVPGYVETLRTSYLPWFEHWVKRFRPEDVDRLRDAAGQSAGEATSWITNLLKHIVSSGFALIDAVALAIITPVTAFFTLRDWRYLTRVVDQLFPRRHYDAILRVLGDIDLALSGFIRGQALVCLALGLIYSIGLSLVGLNYGLAIGVTAGLLSFIPYVGSLFGWVSSIILALVQFSGDWSHVGTVALVFVVGQFMEAYVLTPKLVGQRVGLHPLWLLFALIAGMKLFGFVGVLVAVPTAAVLGVLVRFGVKLYKESKFYTS